MNSKLPLAAPHSREHRARIQALRTVSLMEFLKGIVVLLAAISLYWLDAGDVAEAFLNFLHISPDHHLARMFLSMADKLSNVKFWHVVLGASSYSGLRFAEAIGLWRGRAWAEWIALVSGALYLPFEIRVLLRHASLLHAAILIINLAIVGFMFYLRIYVPRQEKRNPSQAGVQ
jgi:uncharacterized membrane protein (DUF2068 family)